MNFFRNAAAFLLSASALVWSASTFGSPGGKDLLQRWWRACGDATTFTLPALGSVLRGNWCGGEVPAQALEQIRTRVAAFDDTFSEWRADSELMKLERKGLGSWQTPTRLFLEGLKAAQQGYILTGGIFDPELGVKARKLQNQVAAVEVSNDFGTLQFRDNKQFKFNGATKHLSFAGLAKGHLLGVMLEDLWSFDRAVFLSLGGGNEAYLWRESGARRFAFIARSSYLRNGVQDVFSAKSFPPRFASVEVVCAGQDPRELIELGVRSEVLSKAAFFSAKDFDSRCHVLGTANNVLNTHADHHDRNGSKK